ncbi:Mitochondrial import inner membrane translocase subunit TIM44, partial [Fragariocoptes setiger]
MPSYRSKVGNREMIRPFMTGGPNNNNGFFGKLIDNIRQEFSKNKEIKDSIEKFRQETQKLEESEALQKAREKFYKVEGDTVKGSQKVIENVKDSLKSAAEQAKQTEIGKRTLEMGEQISRQAKEAVEGMSKQGENIMQSSAYKTVSEATKTVSKELDGARIIGDGPYRPPEKLLKRSELTNRIVKPVEANEDATDVELHKDSKWSQSWKSFKEDNPYINKVFELKMKYDESDNALVRVTRNIVDRVSGAVGGLFQRTDMSEVLTEICKIDPEFDINQFLTRCEKLIIPTILESMHRGYLDVLSDWCHEAVFNVLSAPLKQAQQLNYIIVNNILDIQNVELALGKIMEQGPVLVVTFQAQQVSYVKDAKGNVVEGDPDKVVQNSYVMAFCRDQTDLDPNTAWRLIDVAMQQSTLAF